MSENKKILEVKDLTVSFDTYGGEVQALRGVSFCLFKGEVIAIVGESGCGKSVMAQSVMRLIQVPPGRIKGGSINFNGREIIPLSSREMERIRGKEIGMIFQDPMTSLNPTMAIGNQIAEGLIKHRGLSKAEARKKTLSMLELVGIANASGRVGQYPHEFSGGMRQRVMIAIALACNPKILIADEPTTALDVTIQAQIIDLMIDLKNKLNTSIIIITHDLGVVAEMAERVIVMYAGKIVEQGEVRDIFYKSQHPYTWGLLKSMPRQNGENREPLIPIEGTPPDLFAPPKGCAFSPRCVYAMEVCKAEQPPLYEVTPFHQCACWLRHKEAPGVERPKFYREGGGML